MLMLCDIYDQCHGNAFPTSFYIEKIIFRLQDFTEEIIFCLLGRRILSGGGVVSHHRKKVSHEPKASRG
jgi:hypothetical protein